MAPRGRKPKPVRLKLVEGNKGKRSYKKNVPMPEAIAPTVPEFLTDEAKVEWGRMVDRLVESCGLSHIDRAAFAVYCDAWSIWLDARDALNNMREREQLTHGLMIRTTNGNYVQNPLVGTLNKARADLLKAAAELGCTPSARSRIDIDQAKAAQEDSVSKRFFGK